MPENKIFLDTNIIIYAFDKSAGRKHEKAKSIVIDLWNSGLGVVSTQVLQEFFVSATKKIKNPLDIKTITEIIKDFLKWDIVINDGEVLLGAIDIHRRYQFSFWDSMIVFTALSSGASKLLSEDLSHGQIINGVEISNPFK